ncbi:aldo/keto reductase [Sphingomonas sp. DG1-23]|uniref:aldo/keto reductase n=1 Tax=Sphingomonas sp. DG1-23 TaxID=3068316 RepID=UPI00273D0C71|nr:aldo/keto reductase [Sphingomonas sp. DG1-23]MDP5279953.1 aldo/keto reductase [Sphingomonas sp. DG1-23]
MRFRPLGRTGLSVSELSIHVSAGKDPHETADIIALALDRGVNTVTIEAGDAAAELGGALARGGGRREMLVVARASSLVPFDLPSPHVPAWQAYPGYHLRAEVENLLGKLGVERLALLQLHAWCPEWLGEGDWLETLDRLRCEGKIAGFGVSLFDHDVDAALEVVAGGAIDAVQLMYNVFDPAAAARLLPLCDAHRVGVVVRSPLYYGALAPAFDPAAFADDDWRRGYFFDAHRRETMERVGALQALVAPPDRSVTDMALRFSLSHPAVSTVAVGMHRRAHLEANLQALTPGPLDDALHAALGRHRWLC